MEGQPNKNYKGIFSYALPRSSFLDTVFGGWTVRGIVGWRAGLPINVTSGSDLAGNGRTAGQRPDAVGVDPYIENHATQVWLNPSAFSVADVRSQKRFGNLGFNAVLGPSAFNMDAALHKSFAIGERQRVTLRLESFNMLNHTQFGNPNTTLNNTNFGKILSVRAPRACQIALKYTF